MGARRIAIMLDTFEIITTNGVVLWSRKYAPINSSVVNSFISDTFIEEKSGGSVVGDSQSAATNPPYKSDQHTLKWTVVKELGVIFVVRACNSNAFDLEYDKFALTCIVCRLSTGHSYISPGSINLWTISRPSLSTSMANSSRNHTRPLLNAPGSTTTLINNYTN